MTTRNFDTVLIANRGEIALRIMRTLREMGLKSVAVYSDADCHSRHRKYADRAVRLPGNTSVETYLNIPAIIEAMKVSGATAVHPGYGFLSENAAFADAVQAAGFVFIGPSPEAMRLLGDKVQAKKLMIANKIPVTPGSEGALTSLQDLENLVAKMGYPLILKAAAGGGGRGMRVVRAAGDLKEAFTLCQREALEYFGNREIFAERYIENPRHIEVQILCDSHGNGFHLNERDCSVQRRHQKLVEEAPSAFLNPETRSKLGAIAVKAAQASGYEGVGTVEFICEDLERIYFMEVNTRIQVEHTVSEEITRLDLVAQQIKVARGERLSLQQASLAPHGWSIECRINAENPMAGFSPTPGRISKLSLPTGLNVRVDTHIYEGYEIPSYYDSMIAKLIVWGEDRNQAIERMKRALAEFQIEGVQTTVRFHEAVLGHPEFVSGHFNTGFIEKNWQELEADMERGPSDPGACMLAAIALQESRKIDPGTSDGQWQKLARREALGYFS